MEVTLEFRSPTVDEFNSLRQAAGWPLLNRQLTELGLSNSLFSVCLLVDGEIAAMGRVVGDAAIYFHISDVIVLPEFQRMGFGRKVMNQLIDYIESNGGTNTNVGLMSSKGREPFYERFGFQERPSEKFGAGMIKILG